MNKRVEPVLVKCNECAHTWTIDKYVCIDAQRDIAVVQLIETGLFFSEFCPNCGREYEFVNPTIYYDDVKKIMICFVEGLIDSAEAEYFIQGMIDDLGEKSNKISVRLTSTCNEFREKVILSNNDLDDRVIEIIKLNACDFIREEGCQQHFKDIRCAASKDKGITIDFIGNKPKYLALERDRYESYAKRLQPLFDNMKTPLRVDREWAMIFCEKNNIN